MRLVVGGGQEFQGAKAGNTKHLGDLGKLPRWLGQIYNLDLPEHKATLIRVLQNESRQKRIAMMAPEPPADFVKRPKEFDSLKRQLLDAKGDAVAITAALRGVGGYGKTTLAEALAHDPDIGMCYPGRHVGLLPCL
jgi:hypothetical protein